MEDDILKYNLLKFFELFQDKPYLMIEYLIDNDILTDKTKKFFINNDYLKDFNKDKKPFFRNFDEMSNYYDLFFINNGKKSKRIDYNNCDIDILKSELLKAIKEEKYEKASMLQKKINKNNTQ